MPALALDSLNPEQRAAVTLPPQNALILAGAGSGKTRVLTTRIAWLIGTQRASPASILAVTFTNKAAKEMLARLAAMLPFNLRGMWIGTFHGLCNRFLRLHYRDAGLPQLFQILDSADQLALIKRVYKANGIDDERFPARALQGFINTAKDQGLRPGAVEAHDDYTRRQVEHYRLYEGTCQREGVVDFAELLLRSYELLSRNETLREHYRNRFRHLLVDEFQDTNLLQYRWLEQLAGPESAIFAVGDDDQSIYAFRGAEVANMQRLERDYAPLQLIKLEQNYRSQGNILDAANALIAHNATRLGKNLWTSEGKGEPLRAFAAATDAEEAQFVVETVRALCDHGLSPQDVALLYRSNAQSRVLEHTLFNAGMPYRVYGGMRFFERAEVKHALAYLRLIANPEDDNALLRVVNFPPRGIGARSLESLQEYARGAGVSLWSAACAKQVGGKGGASLAQFVLLVERLRVESAGLALPEVVEQVLAASGLLTHYRAEKDGQERLENLEELVNAAAGFLHESGGVLAVTAPDGSETQIDPLVGFLAHAALEAGETQAAEGRPALQLMTVHAAKGLEFDTVFITGLEEGLFPHENSLNEAAGPEEERRLMYVAITRARRRLYLTLAQSRMLHGQTRYNVPSRFFSEMPADLLQWLSASPFSRIAAQQRSGAWPDASSVGDRGEATSHGGGLRIGQTVRHAKFGLGVIIQAEGLGTDARVQVNFHDAGVKWLALEYANLQAAG